MNSFILYVLCFISLVIGIFTFKCGHSNHNSSIPISHINVNYNNTYHNRKLSNNITDTNINNNTDKNDSNINYNSFTFNIDYSYLTSQVSFIDEDYIRQIKNIFRETTSLLSDIISIENHGSFKLDYSSLKNCLSRVYSNSNLKYFDTFSSTINEDIIIFPLIKTQRELGDGVLASAHHCAVDSKSHRPIAGVISISNEFNFIKPNSNSYYQMIILHELTHILVFSLDLFPYFINQPAFKSVYINDTLHSMIVTPKVVMTARKHFNCDSLIGVDLENNGGFGSALSHWESRVMLGDYMLSTNYDDNVISEITLALFEDSGWYKVNYYTGGLFRFGKDKGCEFIYGKCINEQMKTNYIDEFCFNSNEEMCYSSNLNKGKCYLKNAYVDLPEKYQYFYNDKTKGGFPPASYCPVAYYSNEEKNGYYLSNNCKYGINSPLYKGIFNEVIGNNSICVESSLINVNDQNQRKYLGVTRAMCYEIKCDYINEQVIIYVNNNTTVYCRQNDIFAWIEGYDGKIKCPNYNKICSGSVWCNSPQDCIDKKSISTSLKDIIERSYTKDDLGIINYGDEEYYLNQNDNNNNYVNKGKYFNIFCIYVYLILYTYILL